MKYNISPQRRTSISGKFIYKGYGIVFGDVL